MLLGTYSRETVSVLLQEVLGSEAAQGTWDQCIIISISKC